MTTSQSLQAELQTLRCVVASHRMLIDRASEALDGALENACIPTKFGRYTLDLQKDGWRFPAIAQARRELLALRDDSGFYWAESRIHDLESLLGLGFSRQLPFAFATMAMPAHPEVAQFIQRAA